MTTSFFFLLSSPSPSRKIQNSPTNESPHEKGMLLISPLYQTGERKERKKRRENSKYENERRFLVLCGNWDPFFGRYGVTNHGNPFSSLPFLLFLIAACDEFIISGFFLLVPHLGWLVAGPCQVWDSPIMPFKKTALLEMSTIRQKLLKLWTFCRWIPHRNQVASQVNEWASSSSSSPFSSSSPPTYSGVNYDDWARKEKRKRKENRRWSVCRTRRVGGRSPGVA